MTRLVALDIDGTLLGYDESLSNRTADAVQAVQEAGHQVVLSTGRSLISTLPVAARLGLTETHLVCSNGAVTVRQRSAAETAATAAGHEDTPVLSDYDIVDIRTFHPGAAIQVIHRELPDALFATEVVGWGFKLNAPFPDGELQGEHHVVSVEELQSEPVTRVVVRSPGRTSDDFHDLVAELGLSEVTFAIGWTAWMDIAPHGVTKASALEQLRQAWGIDPADTVAIGDGFNDIDMLRWAARGVAMGHAAPAVKRHATETTADITSNGAAITLESLLN